MLDKATIEHIATLARIGITPEECEQYRGELSRVLDFVDELKAFEGAVIENSDETATPTAKPRADHERNATPVVREQIIANMPHTKDGALTVRKVL